MRTMRLLQNIWRSSDHNNNTTTEEPKHEARLDLNLLGGGESMNREELSRVNTPPSTHSFRPISHVGLVNRLQDQLTEQGQTIVQEKHLVTNKGNHYFGLFEIQPTSGSSTSDTANIVGLRNSHDKKFPAGIMAGDAPFVCSNLCFDNEIVINRRHTSKFFEVIDGLLNSAVSRLLESEEIKQARKEKYESVYIDHALADHLLLEAYRNGACSRSQVLPIMEQYINPEHDTFKEANVYSLKNAFSNIWRGNVFNTPRFSKGLHKTLDAFTGFQANA